MDEKKKLFHGAFQGSFAIEASVIMPFILFLLWHVIFFSFYAYHQSLIFQGNYCTALYTERSYEEDSQKPMLASKKYRDAVESRLVWGNVSKEIKCEKDVSVKSIFKMESPMKILFLGEWQLDYKQTADRWEPVGFIRNCRKAENVKDYFMEKNKE